MAIDIMGQELSRCCQKVVKCKTVKIKSFSLCFPLGLGGMSSLYDMSIYFYNMEPLTTVASSGDGLLFIVTSTVSIACKNTT